MHKRYQVVFAGKYKHGSTKSSVVGNLVLFGIDEAKAKALVARDWVVLKRFDELAEAKKMVSKLETAGLDCTIEEIEPPKAAVTSGESALVSLFSRLSPISRK